MLDTNALIAIRATQALTMTQTATILRMAEVSDGMGGMTRTWASAGTTACRVGAQLNQPQQMQFAARLGENVGWRLTAPAETSILLTDVLQVGSRYFEVLGILAPATYETARVCICVEREAVTVLTEPIGSPIGLLLSLTYA